MIFLLAGAIYSNFDVSDGSYVVQYFMDSKCQQESGPAYKYSFTPASALLNCVPQPYNPYMTVALHWTTLDGFSTGYFTKYG